MGINQENRINEVETENSLNQINLDLYTVIKSVCKIIINESNGTGFLIKLYKNKKDFYCLMTNEHIVKKQMIYSKVKITIFFDGQNERREIILNENNNRYIKEYTNDDLDIVIIEIIKEDNIDKKYFLLPYIDDYNLINQNIYIVQFPHGNLSYSKGKITEINNNEITHNVHTKAGSSGSPIFLENTTKVIGIHKQGDKFKKENYGDLIYPLLKDLDQTNQEDFETIENINKIILNSLLDKIIDNNYMKQIGPTDWAYSLSAIIYLASSRIFGRKIENFENILNRIKTEEKEDFLKGRNLFKLANKYLKLYKLKGKIISPYEARKAVMKGRPCLCCFYLDELGWKNFCSFFLGNPKGILTMEIINQTNNSENIPVFGHAVVLITIENNCLKFLNTWGNTHADNGLFRIENEKVLGGIKFMDVYWYESDLIDESINKYNNNFLSFIKQASNYLSNSNINIREELKKDIECLKCKVKLPLESFELILNQEYENNDGKKLEKLRIKCLKCSQEFESDSVTTLLYLNQFFN